MKRLLLLCLLIIAACTPAAQETPAANQLSVPMLVAPPPAEEFIASDIEIAWEWPQLTDKQIFVVRVWFEDDETNTQEIWTEDKHINIQPLIDSFSRDMGAFRWRVAVVNRNEQGGFDSMATEWSETRTLNRVRRFSLQPIPPENQSDLARLVSEQSFSSQFEAFNYLRDFIHNNTHITSESDYAADYSDAMQQVYDYAQGLGDAPSMYCNGMSTGMLTVFLELGIESRLIFLYGQPTGWISQHTTLEVFNNETQRWEVQDPTFNLYFVDTITGERASIERLVFGDLDTIEGCTTDGTCSRAALATSIEQYLTTFRYGYSSEFWINPNRMDISRRVPGLENNNLPEYLARITGIAQRDLTFRFDSWEPVLED